MRRAFGASDVVRLLIALLICRTVATVLVSYRDYFPPDFHSDFLLGRDAYFWGLYRWAFYLHIVSGPASLIAGMLLVSTRFRQRHLRWHRVLGRLQVANVVLLVTPSGLWMAPYAATGGVAAAGFATLAVATGGCALYGWYAALQRQFDSHRQWMLRCFVLLCSAVVLRVIGGASELLGWSGTYPYAAWLSWLVPLAVLEWTQATRPRFRLRQSSA